MTLPRPLPPPCQCGAHHLEPYVWQLVGGVLYDAAGGHARPPLSCTPRRDLPEEQAKLSHRLEEIGAP